MTEDGPDPILAVRQAAHDLLPWILDVRRRLHRVPELALDLPKTQAIVVETLRTLGLECRLGRGLSSVVAEIQGTGAGATAGDADRTIMLRADMDALPVVEETGLPFASEHPGVMHACGHDAHMAMLLGAARLLVERRDHFAGRVILAFQPGEEGAFGGRLMLEEGLLDRIEGHGTPAAFGLHIFTRFPTGTINVRPGPMLAAVDTLYLTVRGRGGHASAPHLAIDPIPIAAELILALQLMVTRTVDVADPVVVTIAKITGGTTNNIIPATVELEGTLRSLSAPTREATRERIQQVCDGIAAAHGATIDLRIEHGYPVTRNDPAFSDLVLEVARGVAGEDRTIVMPAPHMVGEDFAYLLERIPGVMAFLGARPPGVDPLTGPENHAGSVVFDESALALGAAMHAMVALRHLGAG